MSTGGPRDRRADDDPAPRGEDGREGGSEDAEEAIDASLHLALSDLERMLDSREGSRGPEPDDAGPAGADEDGEQYTIPLLDEVAIPGPTPVVPAAPAPDGSPEPELPADDEPAVRARIAARIASEMDVIVQDRIEEALERAREEIRKRVRDHMDIILPEIVEELVQARRRRDGS